MLTGSPTLDPTFGIAPYVAAPKERKNISIVTIVDDPMALRLITVHLSKSGYGIETAENGTSGLELVGDDTSVVLVDLRLPDLTGFQVLRHIHQYHPTVQVIVLTEADEVNDAVQAMREGAFRFITKPFSPDELLVNVDKAITSWKVAVENQHLKAAHCHNVPVRSMEFSGDMHVRLMEQVQQIAELDSTVFIGGETGTGKSTIARMIHRKSKRSKKPFVTVNCASLPRDLIQSELFGHTKGSFTGAVNDRIGHAEVADGGTLFLDEIGDLPLDLQPKLLTFLQDRTIQRLGSTKSKQVDVRLIAATHRDLAAMCRKGLFRQDLYFRLLVLNLELPALRNRLEELQSIIASILKCVCERQSLKQKSVSPEAMRLLMHHSWPGNIRELENVLERAVAFSKSDFIEPKDLLFNNVSLNVSANESDQPHTPPQITHDGNNYLTAADRNSSQLSSSPDEPNQGSITNSQTGTYELAGKTLEQIERDAIIQNLKMNNGNKAKTSRTLGISEKSIYNKMRRLGIDF